MSTHRERILQTKPWLRSTGARTPLGKAISSANSLKDGLSSRNALIRAAARYSQRWQLLEGEIEDFLRRIRPFALANYPLPVPFQQVLDYLGIDRDELYQRIRDEHQS